MLCLWHISASCFMTLCQCDLIETPKDKECFILCYYHVIVIWMFIASTSYSNEFIEKLIAHQQKMIQISYHSSFIIINAREAKNKTNRKGKSDTDNNNNNKSPSSSSSHTTHSLIEKRARIYNNHTVKNYSDIPKNPKKMHTIVY